MKKRLLYINKQYRSYDYLKYIALSENFDLFVIWICPFRLTDPLPAQLRGHLKYDILNFQGNALQPWHFKYNAKLFKLIWQHGPRADHIISTTSDSWKSKIAYFANLSLKKPIAFRKETWFESYHSQNIKNAIKRGYDRLTTYIERHADAMYYLGKMQKSFLLDRKLQEEKLYIFPYLTEDLSTKSIQESYLRNLKDQCRDKFVFLYLGRVIPRKGLQILLRAFSKLEQEYSQILLAVVGGPAQGVFEKDDSGQFFNQCQAQAKTTCRNVLFFNRIPPQKVHYFYRLADVFIHPHLHYLKRGNRINLVGEGWGNVVAEAASMALPLIVSDRVASAYDLVLDGKNGFLIDSNDLEHQLYLRMKFFLAHQNRAKDFGKKSYEIFKKFNNPQKIVDSIRSVLKQSVHSLQKR